MYVGIDFSVSDLGESEVYSFDFINDLASGETITGSTWSLSVHSGVDGSASSHLSGSPSTDGSIVSHRVTGLVSGVVYLIQCLATTSDGSTKNLFSHIKCQTPE